MKKKIQKKIQKAKGKFFLNFQYSVISALSGQLIMKGKKKCQENMIFTLTSADLSSNGSVTNKRKKDCINNLS